MQVSLGGFDKQAGVSFGGECLFIFTFLRFQNACRTPPASHQTRAILATKKGTKGSGAVSKQTDVIELTITKRCGNNIMCDAGVPKTHAEPFTDKRQQFITNRCKSMIARGFAQSVLQRQADVGFDQNSDHAKCGPAQRERILGTRWPRPYTKKPNQRIDLVGKGDSQPLGGARQIVIRTLRPVMGRDRRSG